MERLGGRAAEGGAGRVRGSDVGCAATTDVLIRAMVATMKNEATKSRGLRREMGAGGGAQVGGANFDVSQSTGAAARAGFEPAPFFALAALQRSHAAARAAAFCALSTGADAWTRLPPPPRRTTSDRRRLRRGALGAGVDRAVRADCSRARSLATGGAARAVAAPVVDADRPWRCTRRIAVIPNFIRLQTGVRHV
ncbi:hypothetical protein FGB62_155g03 [Gracilaria domingensis]|nr:hypothetical protein FGB62_155g03 [Gracilaria domingensis]